MLSTRNATAMTAIAMFSVLGVAGAAMAGSREHQLRKELFLAEQQLARVEAQIEVIEKEIIVIVDTIKVYRARFADTRDRKFIDLIADAKAKLGLLTSELEDWEARAKKLRARIRVIRRLLGAITVSPARRPGSISPIGI